MWYKNLHHSKLSRYTQLLDTRAIVVEVHGTTLLALYILVYLGPQIVMSM